MLEEARKALVKIAASNHWDQNEKIQIVSARDLTPEEAIGKPDRDDYPLLTGKEVMMEAQFRDGIGQAFTDQAGSFQGTLGEVLQFPLDTNFRRAVFVATLNAAMRSLKRVNATVHCKDKEPAMCAARLPEYIRENFGRPKIAFVGLQPALIQSLSNAGFEVRATDLDPNNIGHVRSGVLIEDAVKNEDHVRWADIVLSTGSVFVNNTYHSLQHGKPIIYYGVTVAGLAELFSLSRICFCGR